MVFIISSHGTQDSPHVHHDIPTVLSIPQGTQDNPDGTHDIPHGTEHPPRYCTHVIQGTEAVMRED